MAKRRTSDGKLFSPWAAIDAADGFCRLSAQFTEALPEDLKMTANAAQDFGALTASATNLILAVELYLKAVLIGAELPVPRTHDLVELFKSLPENWRTDIAARYNARAGGTPDVTSSLSLYVRLAKSVEGIEAIRNPVDQSLPSLLERNRSAFITWRYIHEGMSRDKVEVYEYEFRRLKLICELLREGLAASLPSKVMSDEVVKPSATLKSPSTSRRIWISVEPVFKEGTPESLIERSANGFPGSYGVKYALTIPGKEFYFGSADLSELVNSGESLMILTATREVKLWDINLPQVKEAHLKTDDKGKVTHAVLTINADNFDDAERKAHNFLMPFLSWLSYHGDVAVDVKACVICENNTETRHWTLNALGDTRHITWTAPSDLNIISINSKLRKLQAAYREGMNAVNPFYKFLCFWKVVEGCHAYRKQRERRLKRSSIVIPPLHAERVPSVVAGSDIYLDETEFFLAYLGEEFSEVRKTMKDILRNAIGHLTPGRVVLDPDDYDDVGRCEKAVPVIKYIARKTLVNETVTDNGTTIPLVNQDKK